MPIHVGNLQFSFVDRRFESHAAPEVTRTCESFE
jgi:hypothetical protein